MLNIGTIIVRAPLFGWKAPIDVVTRQIDVYVVRVLRVLLYKTLGLLGCSTVPVPLNFFTYRHRPLFHCPIEPIAHSDTT